MDIIPLAAGVVTAALVVLLGGPYLRRTAWRIGLIDRPKLRGVHAAPVARSGGLTIVVAVLSAVLVQGMLAEIPGLGGRHALDTKFLYLMLPALMLMGVGMLDDIHPMGAKAKLVAQGVCAVAAWQLGFAMQEFTIPGLFSIELGLLSLPFTMLFIVAIVNAFTLIDGADGLCSGAASLALVGLGMFALIGGNVPFGLVVPLAVAAVMFLKHNFGSPKAFLGDSGSTFLGFMVATLSLSTVSGSLGVLPLLMLVSLPAVDVSVAFFRRLIQGANPMEADRGHIHHILMLLLHGNSRAVTALLLGMAATGVGGAVLVAWLQGAAVHPAVAGVLTATAVALPLTMYFTVYATGGYLTWVNLRNAGPATDLARMLCEIAGEHGALDALDREELIDLLEKTGITAISLHDEEGHRVWGIGINHPARQTLTLPLYAAGRVRCGRLLLQGRGRATRMAFAANLLHPMFPAFMEVLDGETRVVPATVKIPA